ncbi:hypothetical protein DPMN_012978 [Dreissena polymorpha]|uniref:Uncharacterized protein n=1 Tax=Dreissena polymorpha TaxID=45954 RepID=A0A9D4N3G0_DREPO|nr:hypothetical protein DPMN_012978 [Dreissena polymorpha]
MSKFHEDNVSSRLFTCFHFIHIKKTAPPPGAHVFPLITTIFKLVRDIHIANAKNVTSRVKNTLPWRPSLYNITRVLTRFYYNIIGINLLTKFHEDWAINVVFIEKNAPPLGSHAFQANVTIFELIQDIIKTNLLTKFNEDWTINAASRE